MQVSELPTAWPLLTKEPSIQHWALDTTPSLKETKQLIGSKWITLDFCHGRAVIHLDWNLNYARYEFAFPAHRVWPVLLSKGLQVFDLSICTLHNTASDLGTHFTAKGCSSGTWTGDSLLLSHTTQPRKCWPGGVVEKNQTKAWRVPCPKLGTKACHIVPCPI